MDPAGLAGPLHPAEALLAVIAELTALTELAKLCDSGCPGVLQIMNFSQQHVNFIVLSAIQLPLGSRRGEDAIHAKWHCSSNTYDCCPF